RTCRCPGISWSQYTGRQTLSPRAFVSIPVCTHERIAMPRIRPLAAALAALAPALACAGEAITIYSSAAPGTLDARRLSESADSTSVPGYAVVREERKFPLANGANTLRVEDVAAF